MRRAFRIVLLLLVPVFLLSAQEDRKPAAESSLASFFYEITRCSRTGFSALPQARSLREISGRGSFLCTRPLWTGPRPVLLCDVFVPGKAGVIESSFCAEDCIPPSLVDWTDSALLLLNAEPEAKASDEELAEPDLLTLLDNTDGGAYVEEPVSDDDVELYYTSSDDSLRRFTFGKEDFASMVQDGTVQLTDSDGKKIVRRSYDDAFRLVRKETFSLGKDAASLQRLTVKNIRYRDESNRILETELLDESSKTRTVTEYDEHALPVQLSSFHTEKEPLEKEFLDKKTVYAYDEQNRLVAEHTIFWTRSFDEKKRMTEKSRTVRHTYAWDGKGGEAKPDTAYYEDDTMRIQTEYESPLVYTETLFFDGGFSVQTRWEDHMKTLEIILLNGVEQRRRTFAN
ncbi:MAG: hypothetical protein K6G80_02095 [Treponema sp.]|nr:hypothetical protein [Treponema sp.]